MKPEVVRLAKALDEAGVVLDRVEECLAPFEEIVPQLFHRRMKDMSLGEKMRTAHGIVKLLQYGESNASN